MRTQFRAASPAGGPGFPPAVEFPSQRRERVDWHKLASVDLHDLASGCSIEFLQENLTHVAFCDAESEFDMGTVAGQRSLMKMFRLAQLIIQYLFLSQDYMESQLQEAQDEVQQVTEKYQQVKSKLLEQVEEAKKMKMTNRSMRETVKYVNSFALANGIFQSLKCPLCTKAFRGQDFLQAHLWRKHPQQANAITIPQVPPASAGAPTTLTGPPTSLMGPSTTLTGPSATTDKKFYEGPQSDATPLQSVPTLNSRTNDVDSYRMLDMEKKLNAMNENFTRFVQNMEEQKRSLEKENERRQEEVKKAWEDKSLMETEYRAQLEKLNEQIRFLQQPRQEPTRSPDVDRLVDLVQQQEHEIKSLKNQMENQVKTQVEEFREGPPGDDAVGTLAEELHILKKQLNEQKKSHKRSLSEMKEAMRGEYEKALQEEQLKLKAMMHDLTRQETEVKPIQQKPPPSPKTPSIRRPKPPTPNRSTKPSLPVGDSLDATDSRSPSTPLSYSDLRPTHGLLMDAQDTDDDSEDSETDTSRWVQSNAKVTQLKVVSPDPKQDFPQRPTALGNAQEEEDEEEEEEEDEDASDDSSLESTDDEEEVENGSSESLRLESLLRDNPQLWEQMRSATSEVLARRLSSLGLEASTSGLKTEVLTSCLSQLRKDRRKLEDRHEGFIDLRRRLENEVDVKADEKIEHVGDSQGAQPLTEQSKGTRPGVLSRVVKNVRSKVRERSRSITSSMSKTGLSVKAGVKDIFQGKPPPLEEDAKVLAEDKRPSKGAEAEDNSSETSSESEESSSSSSARVEVHNETTKSVSRNLFGGDAPLEVSSISSPSPTGSGARPKQRSYFENRTYGRVERDSSESEWDSEPEYENTKREPPARSDSLVSASPSAGLGDDRPIRLKPPQGQLVSGLSRSIELQLSGRSRNKMAGAVDVMRGAGEGPLSPAPAATPTATPSPFASRQQSVSDSSNTVRSSMWGSLEDVGKERPKDGLLRPPAAAGRAVARSWDSEDDLDISEMES